MSAPAHRPSVGRPTVASLASRVDQLESRQCGPLSPAEHAELAALAADYATMFPRPVVDMIDAALDDLLDYHRGPAAQRFMELQGRCPRTPEEAARSQQLLAQLDRMPAEDAAAWLADMAALPPWRIGR